MKETFRLHLRLMLLWMVVGLVLRFWGLTSKPLWTDEFATIVFSLGNSFRTVALDRVISLTELLQPLQPNPQNGLSDVAQSLLRESNHPPLFFLLTHLWLRLFPAPDGYVSAMAMRSLPALLGVLSIPASFWLGWVAFRSLTIGQFVAAFTAISPFGIYLAQEARHYTLPILWIIVSLGCLILANRSLQLRRPLAWWICFLWIGVNALGVATHYFVLIVLAAEGIALMVCLALETKLARLETWTHYERVLMALTAIPTEVWQRLLTVAGGSLIGALVWLPWIVQTQDTELTRWIYRSGRSGLEWLSPPGNLLGSGITMLYLLPIQAQSQPVRIVSIVLLVLLTLATIPLLLRGLRRLNQHSESQPGLMVLGSFLLGAIALFLGITYLLNTDLTSAFRYSFVYFPAVLALVGASLATNWHFNSQQTPHPIISGAARLILLVALFSLLGALTVVTNLGYTKTHRPDLVVQTIMQEGQTPALVAIAHRTHGQTGRLMGIAWEWRRVQHPQQQQPTLPEPQFLLAHQTNNPDEAISILEAAIANLPRPLNLWLVEFRLVTREKLQKMLQRQNCTLTVPRKTVDGYRREGYECRQATQV